MIRHIDGMDLTVHPNALVAENATLIGAVAVAAEATIWYGAVLRGDCGKISVGPRSHIEDGAVVHGKTALGSDVIVGHNAVLHGCTVEDGCLIGMSTTVMDGVTVGKGSLIAAGSLVLKNMVIPPGSLVMGQPANIAGQTSYEQRAGILRGSAEYIALARRQLPEFGAEIEACL